MKKILTILASAAALFASVSCEKEMNAPETAMKGAMLTFTVDLDGTKVAVATDGKTSWQTGDVIAVSDGTNTENVTLAAADINGASATITTTTLPAGASAYYACYPASRFSAVKGGNIVLKEAETQKGDGAVCVATCASDSYSFAFKNVFALISLSATVDATVVAIEGKNSETLDYASYEINPATGAVAASSTPKTRVKASFKTSETCFVAVPEASLSSGLTVTFYKAAEMVAQASTSNALSISRNKLIKMGDITSKVETITSYYEWWEAGKDIELGEIKYNKATLGAGTLLENGANIAANGVYFVPAGATVNIGSNATTFASIRIGKTLIIGNTPGTRPALAIATNDAIMCNPKLAGPHILGIKNMTLDNHTSTKYPFTFSQDGRFDNIILDNCLFIPKYGVSYVNSANRNFGNVVLYNTDYKVYAQSNYIINSGANIVSYGTVKVKNCRIFPDESKADSFWDKFMLFTGSEVTLSNLIVENTIFYNILGNTNAYSGAMSFCGTVENISIKNNIIYTSTERTTIGSIVRATNNPTGGAAGNNIIYNSPSKDFVLIHGGKTKWPEGCDWEDVKKATSDPLSVHDIATATFTVAPGFESYGPER